MSDKKKKGDKSARSDKETPRPEKAVKDEPVERGVHTLPDEEIETKVKGVTLPPGGSFVFRCLEVKDMKHKEICYKVIVDGEDKYHTKPAKGDKFVDEVLMEFALKVETKTVAVELDSKGLIGNNYVGEVRFEISELLSGYPFDKWYDLQNKVGKEGKKKPQGKVHIQVMYLAPGTKQSHDEFTKPLISLIAKDRLDLFPKKIEDLGGKGNVSDKTADKDALTPLLFAAREGKAGFCKLLVENGANLGSEVDKDGLTCIHFAASNGHFSVLRYLLKQKGAPLNAQDNTAFKNTPLHAAAAANMGESVAILIQAGADFHHLNGKKEAPLHHALIQQAGAPKAVFELVKGGADVYQKNAEGLAVWEVAQRKDLCSSSQTRSHFMKACNVVDPREFALQQKLPTKQRIEGEGLSPDWTTANQFIVTSKKTVEVTCLLYPIMANRPEDYAKALGFCVIKDKEPIHNLPSFQPEGIGFGGSEAFKFVVEPEDCYAVCPFVTDQALSGQFGLCFFQKEGNDDLKITCGKKWKHTTSLAAAWKGDNACGSALPAALKNTSYVLSCDSEKEVDCYVMVAQKTKDVSAIVFDDNRIVPAKFYIGLFVYTEDKKKELAKSSKWHNSKEVYIKCRVGGALRSVLVFPCTLQAGEELDYELSAWCDVKVSLKKNK